MSAGANLKMLSDDELLRGLSDLLKQSRRVEADLVAHIGEVDAQALRSRGRAFDVRVLHPDPPPL
jgi:hypothetical protein